MKETKLLGSLMPSHPDVKPLIEKLRKKYKLPEISPNDPPIEEIYLDDEIIPLDVFFQEIKNMVDDSDIFVTPESDLYNIYKQNKRSRGKPPKLTREELRLPKKFQKRMLDLYAMVQRLNNTYIDAIDKQHTSIAHIIFIYLLTGESEEAPRDWFSKVQTVNVDGEILISVMASQVADPDEIAEQFLDLYKETFGDRNPKVTELAVSTAHYLKLQKMGFEWNYIVGEYIRLNKFEMPIDTESQEYTEAYLTYEQRLRKRIERTTTILEVLLKDVDKNQ